MGEAFTLTMGRPTFDEDPQFILAAAPHHPLPLRPSALPPEALLDAIRSEPTPEIVRQTALRWGWLRLPRAYAQADGYSSPVLAESVHEWLDVLNGLRRCLLDWQGQRGRRGGPRDDPRHAQLATVSSVVGTDPAIAWQLDLDGWHPLPTTLAQAFWISCGELVRRNGELRPCVECERLMEIGPGAFSKNRQLCSDACKLRRHRRREGGSVAVTRESPESGGSGE